MTPDADDPAYRETLRPSGDAAAPLPSAGPLPAEVRDAPGDARFGAYVRVERLGQGAMGEVWKAWDTALGRWVALKFLTGGDETEIARFLQEAQVAGKLAHPNIAAIYGAGEAHGRHFIAMQYIDGVTASKFPRGDRRAIARLVRDAARAVAEAHRHGVVHRDIKPDNLMVRATRGTGSGGGSAAAGPWHVYVMDFGLARREEAASRLSISGAIIGTPAFMAPEQSRGERVDGRADVWSLGATLYELLAGRQPFAGNSVFDILKQVQEAEPEPPRRTDPAIPSDLETIVLKCLEKDPSRRYPTADDLADDLDRFLDGDPIAARPASLARRVGRRLKKRRAVLIAAALGPAAVATTLALLVPPFLRERLRRAETERALALWVRVSGLMSEAEVLARGGHPDLARAKVDAGIGACREHLAAGELAEARYFLGRMLRSRGEDEVALGELDRAVELKPSLGEARLERGLLLGARYVTRCQAVRENLIENLEGLDREVSFADVVARDPSLAAARERVIEDLSVTVGESSWFRPIDRQYGEAMLAVARGDRADARDRLTAVFRADPTYVEAGVHLAWLLAEEHRWEEGLEVAAKVAEQHLGHSEIHVHRAYLYHWMSQTRRHDPRASEWKRLELDAASRAVAMGNRGVRALRWYGSALARNGRLKEALDVFDELLRESPDSTTVRIERGVALLEGGRYEEAIADCRAALDRAPRSPGAWFNLGSALRLGGRPAEAVEAFTRALDAQPRWPAAFDNRGNSRLESGDPEGALRDYGEALVLDPDYLMSRNNRAVLLTELKRFEEARADLDHALARSPKYVAALQNRGNLAIATHDWKGADADYSALLELDPGNVHCRLHRAMARVELEDLDGAEKDYELVVLAGRFVDECRLGLGNVWEMRGDVDRAVREWRLAIEANPRLHEAWFNIGTSLVRRFRFKEALPWFEIAASLSPYHADAWASVGLCRQMEKKWKGAALAYQAALALMAPDDPSRTDVESRLKVVKGKIRE